MIGRDRDAAIAANIAAIDAKRNEMRLQWDSEKVRLRQKLNLILEKWYSLKVRRYCVYEEIIRRRAVYDEEELEFTKMFNSPDIVPFGVRASERMEQILCQLEALISYLTLF